MINTTKNRPLGDREAKDNSDLSDRALTDNEILEILEAEGALPPPSHLNPPPIEISTSNPTNNKSGLTLTLLLVVFALIGIWQSLNV